MGEKQNQSFQLSFNPCLKVDFQGSRVTSDGGLLLVRELDERLGLSALITENIMDDRRGKNTQLPLPDLLRQSIYSRLAGYEDVNDAERLSQESDLPLDRLGEDLEAWGSVAFAAALVRDRGAEPRGEPGKSEPNQSGTAGEGAGHGFPPAGGAGYGTARKSRSTENRSTVPTTGILNRPAITHCCCSTGKETVWRRSYVRVTCTVRRIGRNYCCPEIEHQQEAGKEVVFRADAAFAKPEIYEALEARGTGGSQEGPTAGAASAEQVPAPARPPTPSGSEALDAEVRGVGETGSPFRATGTGVHLAGLHPRGRTRHRSH